MTIDQAIKRLELIRDGKEEIRDPEWTEVCQLGIEALKLIAAMGKCPYCHVPFHLPGQTEK